MAEQRLVRQFLEHRDSILGFIFVLTRELDIAEEIFQDVAAVILEEDRRDTKVTNFKPWAREIARRRVANYFRQRNKRKTVEQPSESILELIAQSFDENDAAVEDHRLRMQALLGCVERLPARGRQMIEGFYGRRMSVKDLAAELDWREPSVRVALTRARKALGDCIQSRLNRSELD